MQNVHYFILVFGWVGGGMGGISPFSCFVGIDFSILIQIVLTMLAASIDGFLFAFMAACYELTSVHFSAFRLLSHRFFFTSFCCHCHSSGRSR